LRGRSRGEAIERLNRSLALKEVAKRESIELTPEEIQARVTELLQQYSDKDIDEERLRSVVENELLTEKIIDWLLEHSTVELVPEGSLNPVEETEAELLESDLTAPQTEEQSTEVATDSIE
jgi:trigger factor